MSFLRVIILSLTFLTSCKAIEKEDNSLKTGAEQTSLYLPLLKDKAVALVANHSTLIGNTHLADSLVALGVNLVRIFSPEHGFRGDAGAGDIVGNSTDPVTGIPIVSLYGSKKKPFPEDMKNVDIVIYDIQDVGVRFYTYISTMHYIMEACAENGIPLIIADRPNPLGHYVDGPVLDTAFRSFVGMHPIPVVYGMTAGELAGMVNGEGWLKKRIRCDLTVIPCKGYDHNTHYDLPVSPSPNLNSMEAVYLYPSLCLFEGTVMSLGRGTDFPFRVIGHPDYPDKSFSFVPKANNANHTPLLKDKTCYGVDFRTISLNELRQIRQLNLQWLLETYNKMGRGEKFFTGSFNRLVGSGDLHGQILNGYTEEEIRKNWQEKLDAFRQLRKKYLLYKDFN